MTNTITLLIIALVIDIILLPIAWQRMISKRRQTVEPVVIEYPPMPDYEPTNAVVEDSFEDYLNFVEAEYYDYYSEVFTNLFNSYEVKRARNGAMMIRTGSSGSYKFAKKGN